METTFVRGDILYRPLINKGPKWVGACHYGVYIGKS